jgi:hypothetical protein
MRAQFTTPGTSDEALRVAQKAQSGLHGRSLTAQIHFWTTTTVTTADALLFQCFHIFIQLWIPPSVPDAMGRPPPN